MTWTLGFVGNGGLLKSALASFSPLSSFFTFSLEVLRGEKITPEAQEPPGPGDSKRGSEDVSVRWGNIPKKQGMGPGTGSERSG